MDGAYGNENFDAETIETICSHFFEREDHSLPVFSREEKAEYESWEAALMTLQRENAISLVENGKRFWISEKGHIREKE